MAGRREEQRRRDQSLVLSFSVTASREGFMVRRMGSFCSFLKCRKLVCIICENEGLEFVSLLSSFWISLAVLSNLILCL